MFGSNKVFPEVIQEAITVAEKEMYDNGIVAVGDIGNTADTVDLKRKSQIRWQNFVEVLSFTDEKAEENIEHYRKVAATFNTVHGSWIMDNRTSLVPMHPTQ